MHIGPKAVSVSYTEVLLFPWPWTHSLLSHIAIPSMPPSGMNHYWIWLGSAIEFSSIHIAVTQSGKVPDGLATCMQELGQSVTAGMSHDRSRQRTAISYTQGCRYLKLYFMKLKTLKEIVVTVPMSLYSVEAKNRCGCSIFLKYCLILQ